MAPPVVIRIHCLRANNTDCEYVAIYQVAIFPDYLQSWNNFLSLASSSVLASFPGPTQLSIGCSVKTESWAGPGNKASSVQFKQWGQVLANPYFMFLIELIFVCKYHVYMLCMVVVIAFM